MEFLTNESMMPITFLIGMVLVYVIANRRGFKGINEIKGGKKVTLENGKEYLLTLDNDEKDIFEAFMNLKEEKVNMENKYEILKGKLLKMTKEEREKYDL